MRWCVLCMRWEKGSRQEIGEWAQRNEKKRENWIKPYEREGRKKINASTWFARTAHTYIEPQFCFSLQCGSCFSVCDVPTWMPLRVSTVAFTAVKSIYTHNKRAKHSAKANVCAHFVIFFFFSLYYSLFSSIHLFSNLHCCYNFFFIFFIRVACSSVWVVH